MEDQKREKNSSQDLLSCGTGGGLHNTLLLRPGPRQTQKVPRSTVLGRLQTFLPQMAAANEKLMEQVEDSPAGRFDIECVEGAERVIEMDVALVELSGSEEEEEETTTSEEEEEEEEEKEEKEKVTEVDLKLPGDRKKKRANIQVLEEPSQ